MSIQFRKDTGKWKVELWHMGRRYTCKSFTKKALAEKWERDQLASIERHVALGQQFTDCTYDEIFELWYVNASSRKRHTSLVKDQQMHRQYVSPFIGHLKISQINPQHFELIVSEMLGRGLTRSSVNKVIQHFKSVFNHSFTNETIGRNPSKSFKQLRLDRKEMMYFSQEEMERLLTYTSQKYSGQDRWIHALYMTLFLTGARLGEVLGLEWNQIRFDSNCILISQIWCTLERMIIKTTKGKKDRVIPLNSYLQRELASAQNFSKGKFVFSDTNGSPIDPSNFRQRNWEKDLAAAGVRQIRIHDARHTYASLFMMNGGNLYELKEVLGHATVKTTEQYAHLSNSHLAGVRDIIKPNIGVSANVITVQEFSVLESSRRIHAVKSDAFKNVL